MIRTSQKQRESSFELLTATDPGAAGTKNGGGVYPRRAITRRRRLLAK